MSTKSKCFAGLACLALLIAAVGAWCDVSGWGWFLGVSVFFGATAEFAL